MAQREVDMKNGTDGAAGQQSSPPTVPPSIPRAGPTAGPPMAHGVAQSRSLFDRHILRQALIDSFKKLDPRVQVKNPVMFVVLVGHGGDVRRVHRPSQPVRLEHHGLALPHRDLCQFRRGDGRRPGQSASRDAAAHAFGDGGPSPPSRWHRRASRRFRTQQGRHGGCEAGDIIPSDGEITDGIASVDESAITGESAPVIRESGGDRSAVTGGTKVLSDRIVVRITAERGQTFLDRMIGLVEGANRQKTPNEIALTILLAVLTIVFLPVVVVLQPFGKYAGAPVSVVILVSLLVCLIPTTIGAAALSDRYRREWTGWCNATCWP